MIEGFESLTEPLSPDELGLVPGFVKAFSSKKGMENQITSKQIIEAYKAKGLLLTGPRIRKIINYIRMHNLVPGLVATSGGYHLAETEQEVEKYIESLEGRELAIKALKNSFIAYLASIRKMGEIEF